MNRNAPTTATSPSARGQGAVCAAAAVLLAMGLLGVRQTPWDDGQSPTPTPTPELRIDGLTLDEWRERMQQLNLQDPQSAERVPGLMALARSSDVPWFTRRQAALTLGRLGPLASEAVPGLTALLDDVAADPETSPQLWSIKALGLIGPPARDAVPQLIAILDQESSPHLARLSAVEALARIGADQPLAIGALIDRAQSTAQSSEAELRRAAIEALGVIGPAASAAAPVLARALDDSDESIRRVAAMSLGTMGPLAESAGNGLLERLIADDSPAVQDAAAVALGKLGPSIAGESVALCLSAEDAELRRRALGIFGGWKSLARTWASDVQRLWDDPNPAVRLAALDAAYQIEGRGALVASRIALLIGEDDRQVRRSAVALLERMGADAEAARPVLEGWLQDERAEVRTAAGKALEVINRAATSVR